MHRDPENPRPSTNKALSEAGHPSTEAALEDDVGETSAGGDGVTVPRLASHASRHAILRSMSEGATNRIYRAMKARPDDRPVVERSARALGVRPGRDIPVSGDGLVAPRTGGMSAVAGSPRELPAHRRPAEYDGVGRDPVFALPTDASYDGLAIRADKGPRHPHRAVEPESACQLEVYEAALALTRDAWRRLS